MEGIADFPGNRQRDQLQVWDAQVAAAQVESHTVESCMVENRKDSSEDYRDIVVRMWMAVNRGRAALLQSRIRSSNTGLRSIRERRCGESLRLDPLRKLALRTDERAVVRHILPGEFP